MMGQKKPTREELAEKVKRLEDELRKLRKASPKPPAEAEGVAEGVVGTLGKMIPGLEKLIGLASQMPEFHERLASIDEEIKCRFKEQPLRRVSAEFERGRPRGRMGIPPSVRRGRRRTSTSVGVGRANKTGKPARRGKYRKPGPPKVHISPETPEELHVDVFDEGDHLAVLAEAGSLELQHITVTFEETVLVISIDAPERKGSQRIELPCAVVGQPKISLAKGILTIHLNKANKE